MEVKKSPRANLESKKGIYFQIGLLISLGLLFLAFEYKSDNSETKTIEETTQVQIEEEIIPITEHNTPPPPPPPPAPKLTDLIDIVENDQEIDDDLELIDAEDETENVVVDLSTMGDYDDEDLGEEHIFTVVEDAPSFPGDIYKWLGSNMRYPAVAAENGLQGRVFVQFVVERDGSITDVKVARGVDPALDREAVRVVKMMPKWTPGRQRGKPVRVSYTLPVLFRLQQ